MRFYIGSTDWQPAMAAIQRAKGIVLITHQNPDADGIGSQLALDYALQSLGKLVFMHNADPVPRGCHYLNGHTDIGSGDFLFGDQVDTVIALDCGSRARLAMPDAFFANKVIINIDHHESNQQFGDLNFIDANYCATGAMIYDLMTAMNVTQSKTSAEALYAALMTDTCSFQSLSMTPNVHRLVALLMEAGADHVAAARSLYGNNSLARVELMRLCLATLTLRDDGASAWLHITEKMLLAAGADLQDSEGLIDLARTIVDVKVAVFIRPEHSGWKSCFRSHGEISVGALASSLGGGGHRHASGCMVRGSYEEVCSRLYGAVTHAIHNA
ncbi:MAG: bifunctional oligoribonuclease/PAP phosphatase NrnA [Mariprofundaceae bacterium]